MDTRKSRSEWLSQILSLGRSMMSSYCDEFQSVKIWCCGYRVFCLIHLLPELYIPSFEFFFVP